MTDSGIKTQAKKIKTAVHKFGTVSVFIDDQEKVHALPGHDVRFIAVYSDGIAQRDIEDDLIFNQKEPRR